MSEYFHVEKPFLDQLAALGWTAIDQGHGFIPSDPAPSLRGSFREWMLPDVFRAAVRSLNRTDDGKEWLTERQLDDLRDQIVRQPNRTLLEANEAVQALFLKAQVDVNELTGEADPVVQLIDFAHPERNVFHAINQFRIDTPGCVKSCIIPDIVLFVNGIPLVVVEAKIGDANTANPMHEAFVQLLRYRNGRPETAAAGLREGEPRLFYSNLLLDPHLRRESGVRHDHLGPRTLPCLERHLAGKPARVHAAARHRARAGTADSGPARARHAARRAAHLYGLHGHRRRQTGEGGLPLPAVPRRPTHRRSACAPARRRRSAPAWSGTRRVRASR